MTHEELMDLDLLKDYLESLCARMDDLDTTEFGELGKAFDRLAETASKARRLCNTLIPRRAA